MTEIWQILLASGVGGIVLALIFLWAACYAVERWLTYRAGSMDLKEFTREFANRIDAAHQDNDPTFAKAREYCFLEGSNLEKDDKRNLKGVVAGVFSLAIKYCDRGQATLRIILNNHIDLEIVPELRKNLRPLASLGKVAPMVGLLGTVLGMMRAFGSIAAAGAGVNPKDLAGDIGLALSTTFLGLIIAILVIAMTAYFRAKVEQFEIDLDRYSDYCLDLLFLNGSDTIAPETLGDE